MAEFKHFSPIGTVTIRKVIPNFNGNDFDNPQKNIAKYEELAVSVGLGALKGQILKNTLQFFQPNNQVANSKIAFPAPNGTTMTSIGRGALGFPVYSNLVIKGDTYQDNNKKTIGSFSDIRIDAVILEFAQDKNLVVTDIAGRNGTVIEYMSAKSPLVHVYGKFLADIPGVYPLADVQEFINAMNSNKALRVDSWYLAMNGIYNLAIKNYKINQEEGSQEYQTFEFDAISDRPVILKLQK